MKSRTVLISGLALIGLTNAIALAGVWYNRSGEPDSRLLLSERELQRSHVWSRHENSGLALRLDWRRPSAPESDDRYRSRLLDEAKLLTLGFAAPSPGGTSRHDRRSREVLVVLELDGPARKTELEREGQRRERARAALAATPADKHLVEAERSAGEFFAREEKQASRLFAVDAGLDREALRARYPDRSRYALLPGTVNAWVQEGRLTGQIARLGSDEINVPHAWRKVMGEKLTQVRSGEPAPQFQVQISFGQRLEPWVSDAPQFSATTPR